MSELTLQRIPITVETDSRLRLLKTRTGVYPNILCRLGFCLSLEEPGVPPEIAGDMKIGREINRYTLLGEHDTIFIALLKTRLASDQLQLGEINEMFLAHIYRGVEILSARVKSVGDLGSL